MLFTIDTYLVPYPLFRLPGEQRAVHQTSSLMLVVNTIPIGDGKYKRPQGIPDDGSLSLCVYVHVCACLRVCACTCVFVVRT